jgi:hypothetical protein
MVEGGTVNCPLCEHELAPLTAFLASTQVGTQCPACGTRLRNLKPPPLAFAARQESRAERERPKAA